MSTDRQLGTPSTAQLCTSKRTVVLHNDTRLAHLPQSYHWGDEKLEKLENTPNRAALNRAWCPLCFRPMYQPSRAQLPNRGYPDPASDRYPISTGVLHSASTQGKSMVLEGNDEHMYDKLRLGSVSHQTLYHPPRLPQPPASTNM